MSPESCAEMYCWNRIPKQAENFFGGRRYERGQDTGKEVLKLVTKDLFATGDEKCPVELY